MSSINTTAAELLIVEDSPTQAARLEHDLITAGFAVSSASDGASALRAALESPPDLIITDIFMPEMDGFELCRKIKESPPLAHIPVVLLTALSDPIDVIRGLECGADNFVVKPYIKNTLVRRIESLLAAPKQASAIANDDDIEIEFAGTKFQVGAERKQILNLMLSSYETAIEQRREVEVAQQNLQEINAELARRVQDRTAALKEAEESRRDAQMANTAKSEFLASMSHELRTPLNAIIGYSELLQEDCEANGSVEYLDDLRKVHDAGRHLLALINDLLDMSKVEAGKLELESGIVDVASLIRDVAGVTQPLIKKNNNRLHLIDMDVGGTMQSDITRIRQVLFNLLSNAAKFTEDGDIRLSVRRESGDDGSWIEFEVADTGIGMSEAHLQRIFNPFVQADSSTSRRFGGTGLGLALCRRLCELLGGTISVTSEVGRGSLFTVKLPVTLPGESDVTASVQAAAASVASDPMEDSTILLIDDEAESRELLRTQLQRVGWCVIEASNGHDGLRLAREHNPNVILLDIVVPNIDGLSVLEILKRDAGLSHIPVVLCSLTNDVTRGFAFGASDCLVKPIERDVLASTLERFTAEPAKQLLIVEDDPASRELMVRTAQRVGWSVTAAENGRVGLASLNDLSPDLILLDLMMPEMDGFEFIAALKNNFAWRHIPIVIITASNLTPEERLELSGQATQIFSKGSVSGATLQAVMGEVMYCARAAAEGGK